MTWYRVGPAGIPGSLKSDMNTVLNKKFGTTGQDYPPAGWPEDVNLLGPLPIRTASGAIASFSDGADDVPISSGLFSFTPKQAGTGTPSPSNPRAISGYTGATIYQTGKNLLDFNSNIRTTSSGGLDFEVKSDGGIRCYGTTTRTYAYITNTMNVWIPAGASLIFSRTDNPSFRLLLNCTFADGSGSGSVIIAADNYTKTWVVSKNVSQIRLELASLTNETAYDFTVYPMLEVGNTRTTWELYKAKTPIVDSFGATIYGGSRATDGTLAKEWEYIASYNGESITEPWISSIDDYVPNTSPSTGAEVAYKLATPTTTTLSALDISTYYGANNIYTDMETGTCSIDYRADIDLLLNNI